MKEGPKTGRLQSGTSSRRELAVFLQFFIVCALLISTGCAIQPRGPVVSHTVKEFHGRRDEPDFLPQSAVVLPRFSWPRNP